MTPWIWPDTFREKPLRDFVVDSSAPLKSILEHDHAPTTAFRRRFDAVRHYPGSLQALAASSGQRWRARRRDASVAGPGVRLRDRLPIKPRYLLCFRKNSAIPKVGLDDPPAADQAANGQRLHAVALPSHSCLQPTADPPSVRARAALLLALGAFLSSTQFPLIGLEFVVLRQ